MEGTFTSALLSTLLLYRYGALFIFEFVSALGLPLPSAAALVASGVFASQGYFSLPDVLAAGFFGNTFGDIVLYFLARRFKAPILRFLGIKESGNTGIVGRVEGFLHSYSGLTITASRLSGSGSPAVSALSGISGIRPSKFIPHAILGEIIYSILYVAIGYYLGIEWAEISGFAILIAVVTIALIGAVLVARRQRSKRSQNTEK